MTGRDETYRLAMLRERRESMRVANAARLAMRAHTWDYHPGTVVDMSDEACAARVAAIDAALGRTR